MPFRLPAMHSSGSSMASSFVVSSTTSTNARGVISRVAKWCRTRCMRVACAGKAGASSRAWMKNSINTA